MDETTVYVGSSDSSVYALDRENETVRWQSTGGNGAVRAPPSIVGDTLYAASDSGKLFTLGTETGTIQWLVDTGRRVRSRPAVSRNNVYIASWYHKIYHIKERRSALSN